MSKTTQDVLIGKKDKIPLTTTSTTTAGQLLAEWRRLDPHTTLTLTDAYCTLCARRE